MIPAPTRTIPNPDFEEAVERRARRLCIATEPHRPISAMPCALHLSEARRALFDEWHRQEASA